MGPSKNVDYDEYIFMDMDLGNGTYDDYGDGDYFVEIDVELVLQTYVIPIVILVGLLGNGVVVMVMWRMTSQVMPLCVYCALNAVLNSTVLILESGTKWLSLMSHSNMINDAISKSETSCKVYAFVKHLLIHMDSWIVVIIMFETLRTVITPRRLVTMNVKYVMDVFVCIVTLLVCFNTHYFWTFGLVDINFNMPIGSVEFTYERQYCTFLTRTINGKNQAGNGMVYALIHGVLADIIPCLIIIIILLVIFRARRRKIGMYGTHKWKEDLINAEATESLILVGFVAIGAAFVLCNLPNMIYDLSKLGIGEKTPSAKNHAQVILLAAFLRIWRHLNLSFKVFLYSLTCQQFRRNLYAIFLNVKRVIKETLTNCHWRPPSGDLDTTHEELIMPKSNSLV